MAVQHPRIGRLVGHPQDVHKTDYDDDDAGSEKAIAELGGSFPPKD